MREPSTKTSSPLGRRAVLRGAAIGLTAAALPSAFAIRAAHADRGEAMRVDETDMALGSPDAPVTIIEYASMTCPHCASFHERIYPGLKEQFVDTGKARYVFREFPLDGLAYRASLLARCAGEDRFFGLIDLLFKTQQRWARAADPVTALAQIGAMGGVSREQFDSCMQDPALQQLILEKSKEGQDVFNVRATPSLVINGETVSGGVSLERLAQLIEAEL